ncbi:hypothetical protein [Prevotella disiens]|uniref:hypothetical protein n=1 Tax=Prevotella disiens TaxID=28130 RepID=UPI00242AFF27|nr:hypothetical protein [Prevotella disiens]
MKKEQFKKEVKELLENSVKRMNEYVDNFCESEYKGFDSYGENISVMDFTNALLSLETRNYSAIGCSDNMQRKSKKNVEQYKLSIIYNR